MRSKGRRLRTTKKQRLFEEVVMHLALYWELFLSFFLCLLGSFCFLVCLLVCVSACLSALPACLLHCFVLRFCFFFSILLCSYASKLRQWLLMSQEWTLQQPLALKCTKSQEQFQCFNHHVHPGNMEPENTPLEFRKFIFQTFIFRFYVNLCGCQYLINNCITNYNTKLMTMVNVCLELRGCHRARSRSFLPKCMGTNIWTLELQLGV